MHADGRAIFRGAANRNFEFAWQISELRVKCRPLTQHFRPRPRVGNFIRCNAGEMIGGDIANAVAGSLDGVHFNIRQVFQNVRHFRQGDPVELQILACCEVSCATVIFLRHAGQRAQLRGRKHAIGNRNAQHGRVALNVQPVLQAQRAKIVFA